MRIVLLTVLACLCFEHLASADNWPAWRGPNGNGVCQEKKLPVEFSATQNLTWKAPLPSAGNSTPIVWDKYVFITGASDEGKLRSLLAFDRETGKELWQHDVTFPDKESTHRDNPYCSGSPTTDGELVYASFDSAGIFACDFAGKVVWQRDLGKLTHVFGPSSTPVLYKNLLITHRGPGEPTHIVALDKETGETVWDTPEEGKNHNLWGSWSTPVFYRAGDHDEFALAMPNALKGYDPFTGKELWKCDGIGPSNYPDVSVGDGVVLGVSGFQKGMMAVRMGGRGDITETHRQWHIPATQQRIGSGVVKDGHLYVANAPGIAECIEVETGKTVWKERLGGDLWGSMLLAEGKLYVGNNQGQIFVLAASTTFEKIAENDMGEPMKAALAPSDGQLFVRTHQNLYCIGQRNR